MTGTTTTINGPGGSAIGNALSTLLLADDIVPGSTPSYELCKQIYLYHPLGAKIAEKAIEIAQSQPRKLACPDSPEERVVEAFENEWHKVGADGHIFNLMVQSRIYGISSIAMLINDTEPSDPVDFVKLFQQKLSFNVYDPLNTAGSLVLSQNPLDMDFQHATEIRVSGAVFHRSRTCVMMNERPIYINFTSSAFGFVGRSVYQRSLFPLKSFIQTMVADDMVSRKAGVIVAKIKQPGSIIDNAMLKMFGFKRQVVKEAETYNVISISPEEFIESINLQNLEGPLKTARHDIIENIASATPMPSKLLTEESFAEGFGEGTEDAKSVARYVDRVREQMKPIYDYFDKIVQHRAWNPEFYDTIQKDFPDEYGDIDYQGAFYRWKNSFKTQWPSLLKEPESEMIKVDEVRLRAVIAMLEMLIPQMATPELAENKASLIQWGVDNFNSLKLLFDSPLLLDYQTIMEAAAVQPATQLPGTGAPGEADPEAPPAGAAAPGEEGKLPKPPESPGATGSPATPSGGKMKPLAALDSLREAVARLPQRPRLVKNGND
jgi:hypothetical protein